MYRLIFLLIISYTFLQACAGFNEDEFKFRFLHKQKFEFSNIEKNLNYSSTYNDLIFAYDKKVKEINLQEWRKEFKNKFTKEQINDFLYKKKNLSKIKNKEIKEYIKFLEKQQVYVKRYYYYYYDKKEKKGAENLISKALNKINSVKSDYLKLRYFFLALRLAHYENKNAYEIYEEYKYLLEDKKSIVKDWIQGLYAGILVKKGERVKGVYEFSKLFKKDKLNWYLAFYNFKYINSDEAWNELLKMAKTKEEKISFFTLRALSSKANTLEELKNIASVDINSKFFKLVLFRELLKSQEFFDIVPSYLGEKQYKDYTMYIDYLNNIQRDDMYIVNLALSYFYLYEGDLKASQSFSNKARALVSNKKVHEIDTLDYVIYLHSLKKIDKNIENSIMNKIDNLSKEPCNKYSIQRYTFYKIKDLYKKQNDELKYYLSSNINYLDLNSINLNMYKKLKKLINKKNKTKLEKYILSYTQIEKNLKKVYTKILINNLKFQEALDTNSKVLDYALEFNIFNNEVKGNNRKKSNYTYTTKEVLSKLIQIKQNLQKNPNLAMDNYLYATALYNLSYWGNSNRLSSIRISNYYYKEKKLEQKKISLSISHFKKALENSKNVEFKAKIIYALAKSELALFDIKNSSKVTYFPNEMYEFDRKWSYGSQKELQKYIKDGYGEFFDKLKQEYSNTKYYQELIKQCANLRIYQYERNK